MQTKPIVKNETESFIEIINSDLINITFEGDRNTINFSNCGIKRDHTKFINFSSTVGRGGCI